MTDSTHDMKLKNKKEKKKDRSFIDRRCGDDRRNKYNLDYFIKGGKERRKEKERREQEERRKPNSQ